MKFYKTLINKLVKILRIYKENRTEKKRFEKKYKLVYENLKKNPQPHLTIEEKAEIDKYWKDYGIKFNDYSWFQWYYGISGIKDPRFIPLHIRDIILERYNNKKLMDAYKDKNQFDVFLPNAPFPNTIIKKINGCFYDKNGTYIDETTVIELLYSKQEVVIKNVFDSGCGRNVKKYAFSDKSDVEKMLLEWDVDNYIVQEVIKQHDFLAQFNTSSVNVMRINSFYHDGKVEIVTPILRFGMPGYATDICFIDGEEIINFVGITNDGYLKKEVIDFRGMKKPIGEYIKTENINMRIPGWDEIIKVIKENAPSLKYFGYIGWDITVSSDGKPIVIEYNIKFPGSHLSQMANGPLFAEYTDEVLSFLGDKANQEKYISKWLR